MPNTADNSGSSQRRAWFGAALTAIVLCLTLAPTGPALAQEADLDPVKFSGSWYNPDRDLEGFEFQVLENGDFLVIWYTYPGSSDNEIAEQSFILGVGTLDGAMASVPDAVRTHGPVFGDDYDKDDLVEEPWGTISVEFIDENTARVDYDGNDGAGSTDVVRLTALLAAGEGGSLPAGISAAWFDPETNGQGWFVEIISATRALVYWFTYDGNGNQAWNLGIGDIIGNGILVREALAGKGSRFGDEFDTGDVELEVFGAYSLEFTDCDNGKVSWFSAEGKLTGFLPIQRLSTLMGLPCQGPVPDLDGSQLTMMSNPTDPALSRVENPEGLLFDLFGTRDDSALPTAVNGGLIANNGATWRIWSDDAGDRTDLRAEETGIQIEARGVAEGGTEFTAINPSRATSVARWSPGVADTARLMSLDEAGDSIPEVVSDTSASAVVNYCDAAAARAGVDFIVGDAQSAESNPEDPGFVAENVFIVPGFPVGSGAFEALLPESAAALGAVELGNSCREIPTAVSANCTRMSWLGGDDIRPICGDLAANGDGGTTARLTAFNSCEASYFHQSAFCRVYEYVGQNPDAFCNSPGTHYRDVDAEESDVWARARVSHVQQVTLADSLPLPMDGDVADFGIVEVAGGSGLTGLYAEPAAPEAGQDYQLTVDVPCIAPGETLDLQRPAGGSIQCAVSGARTCMFNLGTDPAWTEDVFEISGPGGFTFDHSRLLQPAGDQPLLPAPALLSPAQDEVLANRCEAPDVDWEFEWNLVEGAASYGIEIANGGGYSGRFAFGEDGLVPIRPTDETFVYTVTLDEPIENSETGGWSWRVWAVDEQGRLSEQPDAERDFGVEDCLVSYAGMYEGDLFASGDIFIPQAGPSTCTASTTMDLTAEALISDDSDSWIAFEGSQETFASNPNPDIPPEDCEDNSGVFAVDRFQVSLTVDDDTVEGSGQDGNFAVTVSGILSEDGLEIEFGLRPLFPGVSGTISSNPTLLPPVDP